MAKMRLGYIGVGLMGLPMVRRLVSLGYAVAAFDTAADRLAEAGLAGARMASSSEDAAGDGDIVVLNLPTTEIVEDVVFGGGGVARTMGGTQTLVDFSTISVEKGRDFAARLLAERGCGWVDAPVSGGPPASASGTLTVMAGGAIRISPACVR